MDSRRQAKLAQLNTAFTRNYRGKSKNVVIAVAAIPIVDVQPIVGIDPTNIGNVRLNLISAFPLANPHGSFSRKGELPLYLSVLELLKDKRNALVVSSKLSL